MSALETADMKGKSEGLSAYLSQRSNSATRVQEDAAESRRTSDVPIVDISPILGGQPGRLIEEDEVVERFALIAGEMPNTELIQEGWVVLFEFCKAWDDLIDAETIWSAYSLMQSRIELTYSLNLMQKMGIIGENGFTRMKAAVDAMIESWLRHLHSQNGEKGMTIHIRLRATPGSGHASTMQLH